MYYLKIELKDKNGFTICNFETGECKANIYWKEISKEFSFCRKGVRYIFLILYNFNL